MIVLCVVIILLKKFKTFEKKTTNKTLKILIPENLNYEGVFDEILNTYTKKHILTKIKTTDLGSLFELCFNVEMSDGVNEQEFINELRCRNGNLSIILSVATATVTK